MCVGHLTGGGRTAPRLIDGGPPKHRDHAPAPLPSSSFSFQASWPSTSKLSSCPPSSPCVGECIVGVRAAFGRRWAVPARARASLCCCAACVSCCVPVLFVGVIKPAVSGLVRGHTGHQISICVEAAYMIFPMSPVAFTVHTISPKIGRRSQIRAQNTRFQGANCHFCPLLTAKYQNMNL